MVKRFVLFAFLRFEPRGGWNDVVEAFDTLDEAKRAADAGPEWHDREVVDLEYGGVVYAVDGPDG